MEIYDVIGDVDPNNIDDVVLVENWASAYLYRKSTWDQMVASANLNLAAHIRRNSTAQRVN